MYLVKRHDTWWALHDVPRKAQHVLGRRLTRSLQTKDHTQAKRLADLLWLHDWDRRIKNALKASHGGDDGEAALFREMIQQAKTEEERELLRDRVAELASDRFDRAKTTADAQAAERFAGAALGTLTPTAEHLEEWLGGIQDTEKTKSMKRSTILDLAQALPYAQEIDAKAAQAWVTGIVKKDGLSAKTVARILSSIRGYWKHLASLSLVKSDPFTGLTLPPTARRGTSWKPFTPAQVVDLVKRAHANSDHELADLITLDMWTGARIEEVCSLKVQDVDLAGKSFNVTDSKTKAGVREVPIHEELLPTLRRLIGKRTSGYVLADLTPNKYGDRSNAVGKRFGRLKKAAGFGPAHVFHSIRKCVSTQLENALVPEGITADIIGHEKPNITYGIYSGGASLEVKRTALANLRYPSI